MPSEVIALYPQSPEPEPHWTLAGFGLDNLLGDEALELPIGCRPCDTGQPRVILTYQEPYVDHVVVGYLGLPYPEPRSEARPAPPYIIGRVLREDRDPMDVWPPVAYRKDPTSRVEHKAGVTFSCPVCGHRSGTYTALSLRRRVLARQPLLVP